MSDETQRVIDKMFAVSKGVRFGGVVFGVATDRYVWLDDAVSIVREVMDALVARAEKAEDDAADWKARFIQHDDRDGQIMDLQVRVAELEAEVDRLRHPKFDAGTPTESEEVKS